MVDVYDRAEKMEALSIEDSNRGKCEKPNLRGDVFNVLLLLFMYLLQCLPRGFVNAISLILQNRKVTYQEQAEFSLILTVYSFKLVWAPIIDCVYWKRLGRRKSWVIPQQYVIGLTLLITSFKIDDWLGSEDGTTKRPNVHWLTFIFSVCILGAAMQDTAVDGWALTMLQKKNRGYSGACNNVGYSFGQLFGYVAFIILGSTQFSNYFRSVPQNYAFIQFDDFIFFWSIVLLVSTTLILVFKKDNRADTVDDDNDNECECRLGLKESYLQLWKICKLVPVQKVCLLLLTSLITFAPIKSVASLKLMDAGVSRDMFVLVSLPCLPILCALSFTLGRFFTKDRALKALLTTYLFRLIFDIVYAVFVHYTPYFKNENGFSSWYYGLLCFFFTVDDIADYTLWILETAFHSHISDPRFGAMYATLFGTMQQFGNKFSHTLSKQFVDQLTFKSCTTEINNIQKCTVTLDGFHTEVILATLFGIGWLLWAYRLTSELVKIDSSAYKVEEMNNIVEGRTLLKSSSVQ